MPNFIPVVQGIIDAIINGNLALAIALMPLGVKIWASLSVIVIAWCGIKIMLDSGVIVDVFAEFLRTLFLVGIAWTFLQHDWYTMIFKDFVIGVLDDATSIISSQFGVGGSPAETLVNGMSRMIGFMADIGKAINDQIGRIDLLTVDFGDVLASNLFTILFLAASAVLMFFSSVVYFVVGIISVITSSIALGIGPLFVPWIIWDKSSFLFDGWLKFLISAGLYKVVGTLMLGISSIVMDHMLNTVNSAGNSTDIANQVYVAIMMAAISGVVLYLMWQTIPLANGLLSGNSTVRIGMPRKNPMASAKPAPSNPGGNGGGNGGGGGKAK